MENLSDLCVFFQLQTEAFCAKDMSFYREEKWHFFC